MPVAAASAERVDSPTGVKRPLRVLHVIPQLGGGGTERALLTLAETLDREVCVSKICVLSNLNRFPDRTAGLDVEFLGYGGSLKDVRGIRDCVQRLRAAMRDYEADIVHSHLWPAARIAGLAIGASKTPHVVHIQDTRPWLAGRSLRDRLMRVFTNWTVSRRVGQYIAVSEAAKEYACANLRISGDCVDVVPNGVSLSEFRPKPARDADENGVVRIGMVGLFKPEKGHRHLIEAAQQMCERGVRFEIHLAGSGSLQAECEELVRSRGLESQVFFRGLLADVESFLHEMDVFVLPSVFGEGLPLSILEAMACGLPVVATDVAGTCEVITDGENGRLIPANDRGALAGALVELCGNTDERNRLAEAGLRTVREGFSYESVARRIEEIYGRVCPALS